MTESKPRRSGGRAARQEARSQRKDAVAPYLERRLKPVEVIDEAGLVQIEENAEIILSEIGIAFQDFPSALGLWPMQHSPNEVAEPIAPGRQSGDVCICWRLLWHHSCRRTRPSSW